MTTTTVGRRRVIALVVGALVLGLVLAWLFQPWRLVTDRTVSEPFPVSTAAPVTTPAPPGPGAPDERPTAPDAQEPPAASPAPAAPVELAAGELITHEHATTGTVRLLELPDGSRVLRIEGLDTTDGPDLRVWLSDAPVVPGRDGWFLFDDGASLDLGPLAGNRGDANYAVPAQADLATLTSVSIWCRQFSVSFGAAALA